jgi:transcriptional antiterminator NusG
MRWISSFPNYMAVHEEEKDFLLEFYDDGYIVGESLGFIEGDMIFINSGLLQGKESIIKRIDRHKRRAEIELELMGDVRRVSVSLEIVDKI